MRWSTALALLCAISVRGDVLDRIAVTVGKQVITESDLIRDLRVDAFIDRKPMDFGPMARRAAAVRLVDQFLMLREASESHLDLAAPDDAERLLAEEKSKFSSEMEYLQSLAEYRITEMEVSDHLLNGYKLLRFTDLRFGPGIQVSDEDIEKYYETLAGNWRKAGRVSIPTLEESRDQVEKLLTGDRTMKALDEWLVMQRGSKEIQYREAAFK
jgi:hypothetical protein